MFDYTAADKGQLSLLSGETIYVLDKLGGGWWKGRTEDGEVGFFPGSYVRELGSGASSPRTPSSTTTANSGGTSTSNSSSTNGGGVSGAVASAPSATNLKRASTVSKPSLKRATAIYKYVAKTSSELSFDVGDEVLVFPVKEGEASGWWTGALASAPANVAHFPASYVKMIGSTDDSKLNEPKSEKRDKRKSQPATRPNGSLKSGAGSTTSIMTTTTSSSSSSSKPPSKPPPQPYGASADDAPSAPYSSSSAQTGSSYGGALTSSDSVSMVSPRNGMPGGGAAGSGMTSPNGSIADLDGLTRSTDQAIKAADNATKTADQAKAGLVKLQQQSKTVFDGLLQRLDAADKDRQRLEHAMREMHKMIQQSEAQRSRLEQQNKALYTKLGEATAKLDKETQARAQLEARLSRLEQNH
jgi:hypothetical protein